MGRVGVNNNLARDLVKHLKTKDIQVRNVRVGDIIVDDHTVWYVKKVSRDSDGGIVLHEEDDNNSHYPPHGAKWPITILDRKITKRFRDC